MAKLTVHAGDFKNGSGHNALFGTFQMLSEDHFWAGESIKFSELEEVEVASEEAVKRLGGTIGWGVTGAALLEPAGLHAGLLLGGRKKEVTFVAKFKDGRKMLATTDSKVFTKVRAAVF